MGDSAQDRELEAFTKRFAFRQPKAAPNMATQMDPRDQKAAYNFYGEPQPIVQEAPSERYPGGGLRDPMVVDDHGGASSPHAGDARTPEWRGVMDSKWDDFKKGLGVTKALSGKPPPKNKLPKGENPKTPEEAVKVSAAAHTPDDNEGIKELKSMIDKFENGDKKVDLTPIAALVDTWTGSRLAASYDAPLGDDEREKIVLNLKGKLAETKDNLAYKREYLQSQKEAAELRQKFMEQKQKEDRDLKVELANIRGGQQEAGREASAVSKDGTTKSRYLKENKAAVKAIAKKRYGSGDPEDKSYELRVGPINDEIYEFGKHLEEEGQVTKGNGYGTALEFYLANASGPDGAK